MNKSGAESLYAIWRAKQHDPFAVPAWGNLPSIERVPWESVAAHVNAVLDAERNLATNEADRLRKELAFQVECALHQQAKAADLEFRLTSMIEADVQAQHDAAKEH